MKQGSNANEFSTAEEDSAPATCSGGMPCLDEDKAKVFREHLIRRLKTLSLKTLAGDDCRDLGKKVVCAVVRPDELVWHPSSSSRRCRIGSMWARRGHASHEASERSPKGCLGCDVEGGPITPGVRSLSRREEHTVA
eukprot:Polyplicarium_translucidae@DN3101_c0_g1_i5.p2